MSSPHMKKPFIRLGTIAGNTVHPRFVTADTDRIPLMIGKEIFHGIKRYCSPVFVDQSVHAGEPVR